MTLWKSLAFLVTVAAFLIVTAVASEQNKEQGTTLKEMGQILKIEKDQISVSGISSGGFMAHQFHVAHSADLVGAGIIAGGPYYCAAGDIKKGMTECTAFISVEGCKYLMGGYRDFCKQWSYIGPGSAFQDKEASQVAIDKMVQRAFDATVKDGYNIDDPQKLSRAQVILIHGEKDNLLPVGVMDALYQYYQKFNVNNLAYIKNLQVSHAVPTNNFIGLDVGNQVGKCDTFGSPYLNFCNKEDCNNSSCCKIESCSTNEGYNDSGNQDCKVETCDSQCLINCPASIDAAGKILKHIYGELNSPSENFKIRIRDWDKYSSPIEQGCKKHGQVDPRCQWLQEHLFVFEQKQINNYLARYGFLFVPKQCAEGAPCKLHIAFHGCRQGSEYKETAGGLSGGLLTNDIKTALYSKVWTHFVENAGYNEWAYANNIVVLYPQVRTTITPITPQPISKPDQLKGFNPQGCWDLWGYTDDEYYPRRDKYHTKDGRQISAVWQMVKKLIPSLQ